MVALMSTFLRLSLPLLCGVALAADEITHVPTGIIFNASLAGKMADDAFIQLAPPLWSPSPTDVAAAETALRKYLEASPMIEPPRSLRSSVRIAASISAIR